MCRMTEHSIRGNRYIRSYGRHIVCEDMYGEFYIRVASNAPPFQSPKVKYALTVRPKVHAQHLMCDA